MKRLQQTAHTGSQDRKYWNVIRGIDEAALATSWTITDVEPAVAIAGLLSQVLQLNSVPSNRSTPATQSLNADSLANIVRQLSHLFEILTLCWLMRVDVTMAFVSDESGLKSLFSNDVKF